MKPSLGIVMAVGVLALALPGGASAQTIPRDSAVGDAGTGQGFGATFDTSISSFGGTPTGTASVDAFGVGHFEGDVRCLVVHGNSAVIGVDNFRGDNPSAGFWIEATDGGPAGSGLDTLGWGPSGFIPGDPCQDRIIAGPAPVTRGDIVVRDVEPPPARMVGKGSMQMVGLFPGQQATASYAYILDCQAPHPNPRLEVRFNSRRFRLAHVDAASCSDQANRTKPAAGFNRLSGQGVGVLDGTPGFAVDWLFEDGGAGGTNDTASITFTNLDPGTPVFGGGSEPPGKFPGSTQPTGLNTAQLLPTSTPTLRRK